MLAQLEIQTDNDPPQAYILYGRRPGIRRLNNISTRSYLCHFKHGGPMPDMVLTLKIPVWFELHFKLWRHPWCPDGLFRANRSFALPFLYCCPANRAFWASFAISVH